VNTPTDSTTLGKLFGGLFNISRLSVRFFVGATGHSFGAILTINGSNNVILQPLVPFGSQIPPNLNYEGVNRRFQGKPTKY